MLFDVLAPGDDRAPKRRRLRARRAEVDGPAWRRGRAVRRRRVARRRSRSLFLIESSTAGLTVEADPSMGVRAASLTTLRLDGVQVPATAVLGAHRRHDVRRVRPPVPAGLVRPGRRHRPGGARLRDAVRQGARGVRRADRAPPVRRVHGRRHGHRAAGHAPAHLQGRGPCRRGQGLRPRGRPGAQPVRRQGHADRPRRRPAARRSRLRQGAPGRAVVPRPQSCRHRGRCGLW